MFSALCMFLCLSFGAKNEVLGGRGTVNYPYSVKVQECLGFLYGPIREQRTDVKKGEQLLHEAILMSFGENCTQATLQVQYTEDPRFWFPLIPVGGSEEWSVSKSL